MPSPSFPRIPARECSRRDKEKMPNFLRSLVWLVFSGSVLQHALCFSTGASISTSFLRPARAGFPATLRARRRACGVVMQAEESWNVGRFAKTFGFFNGNPLMKLIPFVSSDAPSVPQPPPVAVSTAELVLWNFEGLDQVDSCSCKYPSACATGKNQLFAIMASVDTR